MRNELTRFELERISTGLALEIGGRASSNLARNQSSRSSWEEDYGQSRSLPWMASTRLSGGGSWNSDGDSSPVRKDRVDRARGFPGQALWRSVKASLCPGTMVFVVCLAIATFIVLV